MKTSASTMNLDFGHYMWCAEREADRLAGINAQLMSQVCSLQRQVSDADREVR